MYDFSALSKRVQASDLEIRKALQSLQAVEMDGYWRIIDGQYLAEILDWILATCLQHSFSWSSLSCSQLASTMPEPDVRGLQCCLQIYGNKADQNDRWQLDVQKVAVYRATRILQDRQNAAATSVTDFMSRWEIWLPDGITPTLEWLKGLALVETVGNQECIRYFPAGSLPIIVRERLQELFRARAKWTLEDIRPYVADVVEPNSTIEAFLLKHTRMIQGPQGTKLYCSRE